MKDEQKEKLKQWHKNNKPLKNTKWYTDGDKNYRLLPNDPLIIKMKLKQKRKEKIKYANNGFISIRINKNDPLPEGFNYGSKQWYTDGIKDIKCFPSNIPEGFKKGRKLSKNSGI